jgi:Tfp pilus assembly protein PilN
MASVQFNLLPDVKLEYIKSQRSKNLVVSGALVLSIVAIAIFVLVLLTVEGVQKKQLNDSTKDIASANQQLENISNLSQILTVQNQLQTLTSLHHQKEISSRVFTYLPPVTPINAHISSLTLDFTKDVLTINGTADSQATVNTFADTLKFTTYQVGSQDSAHQAFPSVVESSFGISNGTVSYGLTVTFDPVLFSNDLSAVPKLTVPKLTTTRSVIEDPSNTLFNDQDGSDAKGGSQ